MNLFKKNEKIVHYYHPGIYEFNFPFLNNNRVPNEDGKVSVHYVPIRMKIGYEYTKNDKLVSVQYFEDNNGLSIQNFVERISSEVANTIIREIFHGQIPVNEIEWLEEHHLLGKKKLIKIEMEWDAKDERYINSADFKLVSIEDYDSYSQPIKLKNFSVDHKDWKEKTK